LKITLVDKTLPDSEVDSDVLMERYSNLVAYLSKYRKELGEVYVGKTGYAHDDIVGYLNDYIRMKKFINRLGIKYESNFKRITSE